MNTIQTHKNMYLELTLKITITAPALSQVPNAHFGPQ